MPISGHGPAGSGAPEEGDGRSIRPAGGDLTTEFCGGGSDVRGSEHLHGGRADTVLLTNLQALPIISGLYSFTESNSIIKRFFGFTLGVGVLEESIKALPLYFILRNTKEPLIPQTMVYYGLISGIGFGVLEGVLYQTTFNTELGYSEAFFMNIARLTSLPFLHAIWAGIAGYFLSFAFLYPLYRKGLFILCIAIPAILHGFYDTFGWSLIGLASTIISVILLMYYLKRSADYQSKLITFK